MALHCPVNFDAANLRRQIESMYTRVVEQPDGEFHFHRGERYAIDLLGYSAAELEKVPELSKSCFAGVGNPLLIDILLPGDVVLDHACGAGMDLLLAARKVGPSGYAIGVDMTPAMRTRAVMASQLAGLSHRVDIRDGVYEELPVEDASVDVVISNGVLNLAPDKSRVFREIARVLKPGGRLLLADVVVQRELRNEVRQNPDLWAACVGGALQEAEFFELARSAGFTHARISHRFNCFRGTSAERKVSRDLFLHSLNFFARKGAVC
jgi:SAM-dependent methyltransferase